MKRTPAKKAKHRIRAGQKRGLDRRAATAEAPGARRQVAALPFRKTAAGGVEVLLITSRETGRFIIPKGWPMKRLSDADAAAKEAYEEAGVVGKVKRKPIGAYSYWKRLERSFELLKVDVYALEVRKQRPDWPEKGSRRLGWLRPEDAATLVDEPGLVTLIERFRD
ncbi:MAG TPA: NUDIX hydrolase [Roseiarcus sp.]|nr:NUDIX hydrolase [Roseiarcus sp.]